MNLKIIRYIDKIIGRPICSLLTLWIRFCSIFKKPATSYKKYSKIIFIKLIEQGSTVLAYPALKKAIDSVGKQNVYFLVFKENRPILDILDIVSAHNIIEIDSRTLITFIYSAIKALIKIRKENIDACLDMEFFSRASAILCYLSGADKRVGLHPFNYEGLYRGDLFTHKLIYNPYLHTKILFLSLVEALNHTPPMDDSPMIFEIPQETGSPACFSPTEDEKQSLIKKIEQLRQCALNKPMVVLNPNIGDLLPIRKWPEKNFIRLSKMLLEGFPQATIIVTGTILEKERTALMVSRIKGVLSLAGQTTLRELLTLYCIADVLATNDSGPAHFSTLTPIKSVILFGPETPILYGQIDKHREIITPSLVCSPCMSVYNQRYSPCITGMCLKSIKVEDVYNRVKGLLEQ